MNKKVKAVLIDPRVTLFPKGVEKIDFSDMGAMQEIFSRTPQRDYDIHLIVPSLLDPTLDEILKDELRVNPVIGFSYVPEKEIENIEDIRQALTGGGYSDELSYDTEDEVWQSIAGLFLSGVVLMTTAGYAEEILQLFSSEEEKEG